MSYKSALIAAGAEVKEFKYFGEYQGQWFAKVTYKGETGWVQSWYGSCTYCDDFEREFGYDYADGENYEERLAKFGESYLNAILPAEHFLKILDESDDWDGECQSAAAWIRHVENVNNEPFLRVDYYADRVEIDNSRLPGGGGGGKE